MKDYYYILGLKENADLVEIKAAYRKLSLKFHPDKNDGDKFFKERFQEVLEAYKTLSDSSKRKEYDKRKKNSIEKDNSSYNFLPIIEKFTTSKCNARYNEIIEFNWKCLNTTKAEIHPFGIVDVIGSKRYKLKNFDKENFVFVLYATNEIIGKTVSKKLILVNETFNELKKKIIKEYQREVRTKINETKKEPFNTKQKKIDENGFLVIRNPIIWYIPNEIYNKLMRVELIGINKFQKKLRVNDLIVKNTITKRISIMSSNQWKNISDKNAYLILFDSSWLD